MTPLLSVIQDSIVKNYNDTSIKYLFSSSTNSTKDVTCTTLNQAKNDPIPSFTAPNANQHNRCDHHRRTSSFSNSESYQDLESLDFTHLQDQCKNGSNHTSSIIRLLGKLCDGYETTVQQENNFISKYTTSFLSDSSFANSYKLLDCFIKDLSITFQQISMGIKKSHISEPLIELEREYDKKYNIICKEYGQSYKKYKLDENNLDSYLSDHKILQKSWQSPRKLNQSIGKFIEAGRDSFRVNCKKQ